MMLVSSPTRTALLSTFRTSHDVLRIQTRERLEFIDVTEEVQAVVAASGIQHGVVNIQTRHTTGAIIVNEHEPLLLEDLKSTLERLAPRKASYRHDDFTIRTVNLTPEEKPNGHAHCKALFLPVAGLINVHDGEMQLGRWQRIFFVELDCARDRTFSVLVMGEV
jgi:secondary thiamine-phosphate synthase enzyme